MSGVSTTNSHNVSLMRMPNRGTFLGSQSRDGTLTRRQLLKFAGVSTIAPLLVSCSRTSSGSEATVISDFARARLEIIMRESFIPEIDDLARVQAFAWGSDRNAVVELDIASDWRERYAAAALDRSGPDIAELFGNAAHVYSDRLLDVSDLAEEIGELNGTWIDAARSAAMVDGTWRAIPWSYIAHSINYRQDVLDQLGLTPPETYDEMLEVATQLHDAGMPLAAFAMNENAPNDSANLAYSLLWSFGAHEVTEAGDRVALDSDATRRALSYFRQLSEVSDSRAMAFDEAGNNAAFLAGDISMTQNATSIYWKALQDDLDLAEHIRHQPYPAGPDGSHQLLEINSLSIFRHSPNVAAALDWVRSNTRPDRLRERASVSHAFYSPPFESYAVDPLMPWNQNDQLSELATIYRGGHLPGWPGPASQEAALVYENRSIVRMFKSVGDNAMSIDDAVRTATRELTRVYET